MYVTTIYIEHTYRYERLTDEKTIKGSEIYDKAGSIFIKSFLLDSIITRSLCDKTIDQDNQNIVNYF